MRNKGISPSLQAKNYAFLLLKFRRRSEKELAERLKKKNFDPQVVKVTLKYLKKQKFIDDRAFAHAWVEERRKIPLGSRRLRQELLLKGIAKEIIQRELAWLKENFSEEDTVRELAGARLKKLKNIEPQKAKQRVFGYLERHGFMPEVIIDAINGLRKVAGKTDEG